MTLTNVLDDMSPEAQESVIRLTKDLRLASETMTPDEARFLVDSYYNTQKNRLRTASQIRTMEKSGEPHSVLVWLSQQSKFLEGQIKNALDQYSKNHPVGAWAQSVVGIGPVIAAGLLAHIDIKKAPTAGHIWSFAGLNNEAAWLGGKEARKAVSAFVDSSLTVDTELLIRIAHKIKCCPKWLSRRVYRAATGLDVPYHNLGRATPEAEYVKITLLGTKITMEHVILALSKRPWNTDLKTLCWHIGESFVKQQNREGAYYGVLFTRRKKYEADNNYFGKNAKQAKDVISARTFDKSTLAHYCYSGLLVPEEVQALIEKGGQPSLAQLKEAAERSAGGHRVHMLPLAHVHARAKRWVVKLFLAHFHEVYYKEHFGKMPPKPYVIGIMGHVDYLPPPTYYGTEAIGNN